MLCKSMLMLPLRTSLGPSSTAMSILARRATSSPLARLLSSRSKSMPGNEAGHALRKYNCLKASELVVEATKRPGVLVPENDLVFGKFFTDHMMKATWSVDNGWEVPRIEPFANLVLPPAACALHYGMACFEGMKAFCDASGKIRLFRPEMNAARLRRSAARVGLPDFDEKEFVELVKRFVRHEARWVPKARGYSLYIRPTFIGTQPTLGVGATSQALMFVIASPVGPYYSTGFKAVSLLAQSNFVRAWPGGTGDAKLGGNYAPTIPAQNEAIKMGCQQVLWLTSDSDRLTEVGTMNLFVVLRRHSANPNKNEPALELATPPLDGTILPGVVRDSILKLAREKKSQFVVSERAISMSEIVQKAESGELAEMFGSGTAAVISPIKSIVYKGATIKVPLDPQDAKSEAGPVAKMFSDEILAIQYGEKENKAWSIVVE